MNILGGRDKYSPPSIWNKFTLIKDLKMEVTKGRGKDWWINVNTQDWSADEGELIAGLEAFLDSATLT